jgi:hypothetical protein
VRSGYHTAARRVASGEPAHWAAGDRRVGPKIDDVTQGCEATDAKGTVVNDRSAHVGAFGGG